MDPSVKVIIFFDKPKHKDKHLEGSVFSVIRQDHTIGNISSQVTGVYPNTLDP